MSSQIDTIARSAGDFADARILVIDDENIIIDAIQAILECEVVGASTAEQGRNCFIELGPFDLVFVDKNLPDANGVEIVRQLKSDHPQQEFIILTGYPSLDSAIEAVEAGAFDYIPKPFEVSTLLFKTRNGVAKTRQSRNEERLVKELEDSESRHRALFEASSDAIVMFDGTSGKVGAANGAAQRMFGYSSETILDVLRSDLVGECEEPADSGQAIICQATRSDRSTFPVEISRGTTVLGGRQAYVEVIRDRSERVRMEAERELVSQRLRKSEKMEALGQMAAGVAHDFNNLLVVFKGAVGEISHWLKDHEQEVSEDFRDACADLEATTKSAHNLTRQLLGFGRRQVPLRESLDIGVATHSIINLLRRTLTSRIAIEVCIDDALPSVIMDLGQFEQVLTNLVFNARDAMQTGGTLTISATEARDANGDREIVLEVRDTGIGMEQSTADHIFEPFYTTKDSERGTGLGLATVYGIVHSHRGEINVKTAVGLGTTFEIHLPITSQRESDKEGPVSSHHPSLQTNCERILVVEDHEQVRSFVRRVLSKSGYVVTCANDSEHAIRLVEGSTKFDLLLTDTGLSSMNGHELARRITSIRDMKVLCMSANLSPEGSSEDTAFPLLAKPFTVDVLLARVRQILTPSK